MREAWFLWRGEASWARGLRVTACPPLTRAPGGVPRVRIPGRSGCLFLREDPVYEEQTLTLGLVIPPPGTAEAALCWLRGRGTLVLSVRPDRALTAEAAAVTLFPLADGGWEGTAGFLVQPLKAQYPPEEATEIDTGGAEGSTDITHQGDVPARPLYILEGTGDLILDVGDAAEDGNGSRIVVHLDETGDGCVIDTDAGTVTNLDGTESLTASTELFYNGFRGLWLPVGDDTTVAWGENVTKVTVSPRWRWL